MVSDWVADKASNSNGHNRDIYIYRERERVKNMVSGLW